jgi:hypothetical protein
MTPAGNRRGFVAGLLGSSLLGLTGDNHAAQAARGSERPRSSLEIADFVTGTADHAAAASAAFATLPAEGGELVFGPGVWLLDRPLHFDGKPIRIRGAGNGVTVLAVRHRGTAISAAQNRLADLAHMTSISDLTLRMIAPGAADCAIAISYAEIPSWPLPTITIENVSILGVLAPSATDGPAGPAHFTTGIRLTGGWQTRLRRVSYAGPGFRPDSMMGATAFLELDRCVETVANDCEIYYAGTAVRQVGLCEGVNFTNPIVVGCHWFLDQVGSFEGAYHVRLNGLWLQGGEINTYLGGFRVRRTVSALVTGTEFNRYLDSGSAGYTAFDLIDCQEWTVSTVKMNAAHAATTATAIRLTASGGKVEPTANSFVGIVLTGFDNACILGPGCRRNMVHGIIDTTGATVDLIGGTGASSTAFRDEGESNLLTWLTSEGQVAYAQDLVGFAGRQGQLLAAIANVDGAVNYLRQTPSVAGEVPGVASVGPAGAVSFRLDTQGQAPIILGAPVVPAVGETYAIGSPSHCFSEAWLTHGVVQGAEGKHKTDVTKCRLGTAFVLALEPITYRLQGDDAGLLHHGFRAEDVGAAGALPEGQFAGHRRSTSGRSDGLITTELLAPLVVAFQQMEERLRLQTERLDGLLQQHGSGLDKDGAERPVPR